MSTARQAVGAPKADFAKRVLVIDADQKLWEPRARLLIARGVIVHRIGQISEAPPRWPAHLYDLVLLRADNPAKPEIMEFCRRLQKTAPPVLVALLSPGSDFALDSPVIRTDRPGPEIVNAIVGLLEPG